MKHLHKFASVLLALVMAFSLMAPAFAQSNNAENNQKPVKGDPSITITNATVGHVYEAYQIFSGELSATSETNTDLANPTLSNIQWGLGISNEADALAAANTVFSKTGDDVFTTAAQVADALAADTSKAVAFGQAISAVLSSNPQAKSDAATTDTVKINIDKEYTVGEGETAKKVPGTGYYLVKDTIPEGSTPGNTDISLFMLQVVGPAEVIAKVGTPEPDKKVKDTNDSTGVNGDWDTTADHDINDVIEYQLTAKMPANIENYKTYKLTFTDKMSKGLTLVDTVAADGTVTGVTVSENATVGSLKVYVAEEVKGTDGKVTLSNIQDVTSGYTLKYAKNDDAEAEPYKDGHTLTVEFTDITGLIAKTGDKSNMSGKVIVVEYKAQLNSDAAFANPNSMTLTYPKDPNVAEGGEPETETTKPETAVVFTFKGIVDKVNKEQQPLAGAGFTLYKFNKTTEEWEAVGEEVIGENMTQFTFNGLDDGRYKLEETTVPTGYNKAADIYFDIEATHILNADGTYTVTLNVYPSDEQGNTNKDEPADKKTFTVECNSVDKGDFTTKVTNLTGATLPETGGIGTTIFYVVGGVLVAAAVILLVTKKRMSVDSDK